MEMAVKLDAKPVVEGEKVVVKVVADVDLLKIDAKAILSSLIAEVYYNGKHVGTIDDLGAKIKPIVARFSGKGA